MRLKFIKDLREHSVSASMMYQENFKLDYKMDQNLSQIFLKNH